MPQSLSKVYVHIVFSTKYREHKIDRSIRGSLYSYIGGICKHLECYPIQVGGFSDHVHVLCALSRKVTQAQLLEEIKKRSSRWIKRQDAKYSDFYWQNGYGIFSVKPTDIEIIKRYIINQEIHHRKKTFKAEYRAFLKKYNVEYDERYVWD